MTGPGEQESGEAGERAGTVVYLGLGSNLGDRRAAIEEAVRRIGACAGVHVTRLSSIRETAPVGTPEHPATGGPYLNAVLEARVSLGPRALLEVCQAVERDLGRVRTRRNAARTIDVDILLFGDLVLGGAPAAGDRGDGCGEELVVPHPRLTERRFVLEPLAELAPAAVHPVTRRAIGEHLRALVGDPGRVADTGTSPCLHRAPPHHRASATT